MSKRVEDKFAREELPMLAVLFGSERITMHVINRSGDVTAHLMPRATSSPAAAMSLFVAAELLFAPASGGLQKD
jgi:hypothetical protein